MDHLDQHNILVDYQHGFRKNHSCETQLISTLESISRSHDKKKQVDLIVLDFSKAFDTVAHQRLLQKLGQVGIRNTHHASSCDTLTCKGECEQRLLTWFKNWLCNRTQKVVLEGQASNVARVTSGVPQGTVLGPLCFLVFINDIGNEISTETSLKLFADDSLIFREIATEEDSKILQQDLDSLIQWAEKWQMSFHPAKCQVMTVQQQRRTQKFKYKMLDHPLQQVDTIQYLGVHIQQDLKWDKHVNHIVTKANRSLGFVKRNLHQCPQSVKAQAYQTLVRPVLEYASTAWDPHLKKHATMIESVQRRAARFVTHCRAREPGCVTQAMETLKWKPLETRRRHARLTQMYRTTNGHTTTIAIPPYFTPQSNRYRTRNHHSSKFITPHTRTNIYKNSFFPRTIVDWTNLPNQTINSLSISTFQQDLN